MRFFRKIPTFWLILLPLLIPGMLVSAWRLVFRNLAEQRNVFVETVVDFEEIRQLAREEGWLLADLFAALKKNGASSVAISEDTLSSLESEGKITVLSSKEIRKLAIDENLEINVPAEKNTLGSLWVHSERSELLDRIEQHLSWKIHHEKLIRIHRNLLLINKSSKGFRERVGLGFSEEYFKMADAAGLGLVIRVFNYPGLNVDNAARIINAIPSPASVSALLFAEEEMLGTRGDIKGIVQLFENRSYRIGWVEFNLQDGIESYLQGLARKRPFVRVHSISRKELDLVYNVKRSVARWVRAVKERSLKMLYIRCFFQDDKRFIENLVEFNLDYLAQTVKGLDEAGYKVAGDVAERLNEPRHLVGKMSSFEIFAIGLALILGNILIVRMFIEDRLTEKVIIPLAVASLLLFLLLPLKTFIALSGVMGAVAYSTAGVLAAMRFAGNNACRGFFAALPGYLWRMVLPSVFGGILIAGIYSEIEFLLKFEQFRGIKIAFMLPLLITGIWSLSRYGRGVFSLLSRPVNPVGVFLLSAVAAGTVLYLLRSGNVTFLKPSEMEDAFRTFLENFLVARPRNKEFLVGYPAALLLLFFAGRRQSAVLPVLAVFMQMGQVSAVNSMCHFHTPLYMSLLRIFNGLWLGLAIGMVAVFAVALINLLLLVGEEKRKRAFLAGYFGFGNVGDELLWRTFATKFLVSRENYEVSVLSGLDGSPQDAGRVKFVMRSDILGVLEELVTCSIFVIPGGGVLQSVTSQKSLVYYLLLMSVARSAGAKIVLPAQGLGPWAEKNGFFARLLERWLRHELRMADFISTRDADSGNELLRLCERPSSCSADMVMLNDFVEKAERHEVRGSMNLGVVLRSSVNGSQKIAEELVRLASEHENLKLVPIAFQPGEDELVWRSAGWQGPVAYPENPEEVFKNIDMVVSMRLHGCIVATLAGIPWLGLAYDPKVKAFAEACRWKLCCGVTEADGSLLEEKINLLAIKRSEYSDRLNRIANEQSRAAEHDFADMLKAIDD